MSNATELKCSCGRTFSHEVSLKRHQYVTGHEAASAEPAVEVAPLQVVAPVVLEPVVDHCTLAIQLLAQKAAEQAAYERRLEREARVNEARAFVTWVGAGAAQTGRQVLAGAQQTTRNGMATALVALKSLMIFLTLVALLGIGFTTGRALGHAADSAAQSSTRTHVAAHTCS